MMFPFTEADYTRALSRAWPQMSPRQRVGVIRLAELAAGERSSFQLVEIAEYCEEPLDVFLSLMGRIGSIFAEHMGASIKFDDGTGSPVWYSLLFERIGGPRELVKLRTPFSNSLKNREGLPLQDVTQQEPEQ